MTYARRCVGFGPKSGRCGNRPGTPWTPYFCPSCDAARREHISQRLLELAGRVPGDREDERCRGR